MQLLDVLDVKGSSRVPGGGLRKVILLEQRVRILENYLLERKCSVADKRRVVEQIFINCGNSYFPNIDNPTTFNEKILWMSLYYHNPLITECVDKVSFKNYLNRTIGDEFTIPTIGIYEDANQIDFSALPEEYVLKANWGGSSKQVYVRKMGDTKSIDEIKTMANAWLLPLSCPYYEAFIWAYKNIKPKLLIEKLLNSKESELQDYKFFCFNGQPRVLYVADKRFTNNLTFTFFDMDWNKLDLAWSHGPSDSEIARPNHFNLMKELCKRLSSPFPFVRIDFYEVKDKVYIGEFTFTPEGGFAPFHPVEWDMELGSYLKLPQKIDYLG